MKNVKIGIVGLGFVGKAVRDGYEHFGYTKIETYDINGEGTRLNLEDLVIRSDYIFVCVPTPTNNGKIDSSIVEKVCLDIETIFSDRVVIVKSTITPSKLSEIDKKMMNNELIYNPEFLTQKTAKEDFINPTRVIIGSNHTDNIGNIVRDVFSCFDTDKLYITSLSTAVKCKYTANVFGFLKVSFFNIIYKWAESEEDYKNIVETVLD